MQRYVYYLKSFHKKHYTFTYQTWVAGNNSEAVWKTGFQYNVGNGTKMWIYSQNKKLMNASIEVKMWNTSQII